MSKNLESGLIIYLLPSFQEFILAALWSGVCVFSLTLKTKLVLLCLIFDTSETWPELNSEVWCMWRIYFLRTSRNFCLRLWKFFTTKFFLTYVHMWIWLSTVKLKINRCSPGEKMSGLKRMSKHMLLMDPTALQAFKTTSRLFGSVCE